MHNKVREKRSRMVQTQTNMSGASANILCLKKASTECQVESFLRWVSDEVEHCICYPEILISRIPKCIKIITVLRQNKDE